MRSIGRPIKEYTRNSRQGLCRVEIQGFKGVGMLSSEYCSQGFHEFRALDLKVQGARQHFRNV